MIINANKISKTYGYGEARIYAVKEIDMSIHENEYIVVTGPSGSGKTTLLRLLAGQEMPSDGTISFDGDIYKSTSDKKLCYIKARNIGFIYQDYKLIEGLTAIENIMAALIISKQKVDVHLIHDIADRLGILDHLHHYPNEMSGGQKQRVAIARAIIKKPQIIFADEPTGNLDKKNSSEIYSIFKELFNNGITIVVVSHDPNYIEDYTKRYLMEDGKIVSIL